MRPHAYEAALAFLLVPWAQLAGALRAQGRWAWAAEEEGLADFDATRDRLTGPTVEEHRSIERDFGVNISGVVDDVHGNSSECGDLVFGMKQFDSAVPEQPPLSLDGTQWCEGSFRTTGRSGRVALVLMGEAFRARNFVTHHKCSCVNSSVTVQKHLAENHLANIVAPIEQELNMTVDIYLSTIPCSFESFKGRLEKVLPVYNTSKHLRALYGRSRVKGIFEFTRETQMYDRLADVHVKLDEAMRAEGPTGTGAYEYFIVQRYDVYLDRKFTDLVPSGAMAHRGLTFFTHAHDFSWSFPGEMWNCMVRFWDVCMRGTRTFRVNTMGWDEREALGCFKLGPMALPRWEEGFAFDQALSAIGAAAQWAGAKPTAQPRRAGCSGFDARGDEHRCHSDWFWPPKESWEHRFMPYYYHLV
uniref:Uncharacterized protein n=1 Tax=Alexandrium catenella TaxID=2925 RepID=A0A7S1RBR5_ALECA|mmetsp:Transcript_51819/g.138734  ORF Transcript_51819/g.138734 Transcript_51819/m.138734 type:complete len:415 (+) Transcript_51819:63-1307(+)